MRRRSLFLDGLLALTVGASVVMGAAAIGCGATSKAPAPTPDAALICPTTVADAIGAACPKEGFTCWIGFDCPPFRQEAQCACTSGNFLCSDQVQMPIPDGGAPQCKPIASGGNPQTCPLTETLASAAPCTNPGLICAYTGATCADNSGIPNTDLCQCVGDTMVGDDAGGLTFDCEQQPCNSVSDASIDTAAPPPIDSGSGGNG